MAFVAREISPRIDSESEKEGRTQEESPEWMPASSMCSMIPPMTARSASAMQSTSTSIASSRNLSTRIGLSGDASTALVM